MKLNLGSGWRNRPGWINVDLYDERADVREDLRTVDFPAGGVTEILASHVLEHFTRKDGLKIVKRCFEWLAPGGTLAVEMPNRTRCLELGRSNDYRRKINGVKGIAGGRSDDKEAWHQWLIDNADAVLKRAARAKPIDDMIPPQWNEPGAAHLYVWDAEEFRVECERIGFAATTEHAREHGARYNRDFRVVGVKP